MIVRDFVAGDQAAVRALVLAGLGERWGSIDETMNPDLDDIAAAYGTTGRTVVVEDGGVIVATGTIHRGRHGVEIVRVSVAASARRGGVGRAVVAELLRTAAAWGVDEVVLETTSTWTSAVEFWLSCGFAYTHEADGETWFRASPTTDGRARPGG